MSELKPTAFRVFDNVEKRYVQDDHLTDEQAPAYVLADTGWLAIIYRKGGAKPADESRYTVERWTGLYDAKGKAVYEGDVFRGDMNGLVEIKVTDYDGSIGFIAQNQVDGWIIGLRALCRRQEIVGTVHDRSAEHG